MVYCKTETNLWPKGPEMWECPTNKGSAAALPRYSSAVCPTGVRCTSAVDMWSWAPPPFDMWVLAFMTAPVLVPGACPYSWRLFIEDLSPEELR
jgi:hypothetical protein